MTNLNRAIGGMLFLLIATVAPGRMEQSQSSSQRETEMHPGHAEMRHLVSATARLDITNNESAQQLTARIGPVRLPAHSDHMAIAQPRDFFLTIPFDGWLVAFHPGLAEGSGAVLTAKLLHHAAFWNASRSDFLCPNKEEHVFGAGSELSDWPATSGFGYRVHPGDKIRISAMFANPTAITYPEIYLDVRADYRVASAGAEPLKNVYPMWMSVEECGDSGYTLEPGKSTATARFTMKYSGMLLGAGGHLHDYGRDLKLEDLTHVLTVADFIPRTDSSGHILSMPVVSFSGSGGYRLERGQTLKVTATYDNSTGRYLLDAAMGIVVGYFLPDQDIELGALERRTPR